MPGNKKETLGERLARSSGRQAGPAGVGPGGRAGPDEAIGPGSASDGATGAGRSAPRDEGVYAVVTTDKLFPMKLSSFMHGALSCHIEFRNGGTWTDARMIISRTIHPYSAPDGSTKIGVSWSSPGKSSMMTTFDQSVMIEHRYCDKISGKTMYTVGGSGGCVWVDGDLVTFTMNDRKKISFEQWIEMSGGK